MKIYFDIWAALAGIVAMLALYRKLMSHGHHTVLHVRRSELTLVPAEMAYAQRLNQVDRWGKALTWVSFVYGFALLFSYVYFIALRTN